MGNRAGTLGNPFRKLLIEISSAEILALFTSPKQLIAAPGAGKVIDVISCNSLSKFNSIAYATYTSVDFGYSTTIYAKINSTALDISQSYDVLLKSTTEGNINYTLKANQGLYAKPATGNPTAGNGTIKVYLTYQILDIP